MIWPWSAYCRGHQPAEDVISRHHAIEPSLQRAQPAGSSSTLRAAHRGPRAAVRMKDVAVPAHAHVVDHVQRQRRQRLLGGGGEGHRRMDAPDLVGDHGAGSGARSENSRDTMWISCPRSASFWASDRSIAPARRGADRNVRRPVPTFMAAPPVGAPCCALCATRRDQSLVAAAQLAHAQVTAQQGDLLLAADAVARRRVGQLRQVLDDPPPAQPSPPLHALQVDQANVELARRRTP